MPNSALQIAFVEAVLPRRQGDDQIGGQLMGQSSLAIRSAPLLVKSASVLVAVVIIREPSHSHPTQPWSTAKRR